MSVVRRSAGSRPRDNRGGDEVDDQRDDEQGQPGSHERRSAEGRCFAVAQRNERGDRVGAVLQDVRLEDEHRGDDHEDRDGFAQGATEAEQRDWCRERMAGFKCPARVVFADDTEMPRTATGKVLHRVLRQRFTTS